MQVATAAVTDPDESLDLGAIYLEQVPRVRQLVVRLGGPRMDSEDLTQEVFAIAWERLPTLKNRAAIHAWLTGIAVKVAAAARRRARVRRFFGLDEAEGRALADPRTPVSDFENAESSRIVYSLLEGMSEKKRTVFILFELQGLTGEEIARAVGCPLKTVWTRLFHARREFAGRLEAFQARETPSGAWR
ncbi:MAG: RNA polymerase sigma factor [Myxococcales bacterium]